MLLKKRKIRRRSDEKNTKGHIGTVPYNINIRCPLGFVYKITKEPIKEQELKTKLAAYQTVFSELDTTKEADEDTLNKAQTAVYDADFSGVVIQEVVMAYDKSGNYLGMIITVKDSNGYGGDIRMTVGIDKAETITGLGFLELNETAGLGMKAKESSFKNQFKGKKADKINYSKSGAQADDEIDAISSATITTSAVCEGVNAAISAYKAVGGVEQ